MLRGARFFCEKRSKKPSATPGLESAQEAERSGCDAAAGAG